jgi:hypothetical protein
MRVVREKVTPTAYNVKNELPDFSGVLYSRIQLLVGEEDWRGAAGSIQATSNCKPGQERA